jgi:hypothetical protein
MLLLPLSCLHAVSRNSPRWYGSWLLCVWRRGGYTNRKHAPTYRLQHVFLFRWSTGPIKLKNKTRLKDIIDLHGFPSYVIPLVSKDLENSVLSSRVQRPWLWKSTDVSGERVFHIFVVEEWARQETSLETSGKHRIRLVSCMAFSSTLKMEATCSSETSVDSDEVDEFVQFT